MTSVAPSASQTMPALTATARVAAGKTAARRLRAEGRVPAVAYGKGLAATPLSVPPKEILSVLRSERGQNTVLKLGLTGEGTEPKDLLVMIKEFSYHPVTRALEHVDFIEVKLNEAVDVQIPFFTTGKPVGVTNGGILRQVYRTLPVRCLPDRIPMKIVADVTHLALNEHVSTKELKLDEGVTVLLPPDQTIAAVVAPEKDRTEDVAPTGAVAAAAPAAGAAAAKPGAPAAKADAKDAKAAAPAKDAKKK